MMRYILVGSLLILATCLMNSCSARVVHCITFNVEVPKCLDEGEE